MKKSVLIVTLLILCTMNTNVVIPGSSNPAHIKENIDVLDFALSNVEMQRIRALDKEARYFNMPYEQQVKWFSGWNPTD